MIILLKLKLKKIIDSCTSKDQLVKTSKEIDKLEKELTLCHANAYKFVTEKNKIKGIKKFLGTASIRAM